MRIVDVWESSEQQDRFRDGRLMPAIQQAGVPLTEAPPTQVHELHHLITPEGLRIADAGR